MRTTNHPSAGQAGSHVPCPLAKTALPAGKAPFTWLWCWVAFGEQSMVISRTRRSTLLAFDFGITPGLGHQRRSSEVDVCRTTAVIVINRFRRTCYDSDAIDGYRAIGHPDRILA